MELDYQPRRAGSHAKHFLGGWQGHLTVDDYAGHKALCESFPVEFADRLLSGEPPLRVWRDYRGPTLQSLTESCGVTRQMLSMIEHAKAKPSADLLGKLADALGCDMDGLHA